VLAAWNDGTGLHDGSGQTVGWGVSTDGGLTWFDAGTLPLPGGYPQWRWTSSPVVAVDAATGAFYCAALADASPAQSAIGVLRGRFTLPAPGALQWDPVVVARSVSVATDFLHQPWLAVDAASGRVQLAYVRESGGVGRVEAQAADSLLASWSAPLEVSDVAERGRVARPRIAAGEGVAQVAYFVTGLVDADAIRTARSADGGATWAAARDAVSLYSNPGSGAPGYNLPQAVEYASLALDQSGGAHDGRLHLAWSESLDWYDDLAAAGSGGPVSEAEPDDTPATATPAGVGATLRGAIASATDADWFALPLSAGQGVLVDVDSLADGQIVALRLYAPDGATRLCYTQADAADLAPEVLPPAWIFTAPESGTYYVRLAPVAGTGGYRARVGAATQGAERGRDQRDVFAAHSDDGGATWSTPVRVSDSPVGFDDWLPEIAVAGDGHAYCAWYDGRDAAAGTAGGVLSTYLARSDDGGDSWITLGATSDTATAWTSVESNLVPNQGDHLALFADDAGVTACWSDGRGGSPDVEMAYWTLGETPTLLSLVACDAWADRVELTWYADRPGLAATLERRAAGGSWAAIAALSADGTGEIRYVDRAVAPGIAYGYRLAVTSGAGVAYLGETSVTVPAARLALSAPRPNPAAGIAALEVELPSASPASLAIYDVSGRRVAARELGSLGPGRHVIALEEANRLPAGAYRLRLSQSGRAATTGLTLVR